MIELAKPRPVDSSQRNRSYSDIGTVTKAALNSKCNERISQLATGKTRKSTELIEFDPDAYKVSHRLWFITMSHTLGFGKCKKSSSFEQNYRISSADSTL